MDKTVPISKRISAFFIDLILLNFSVYIPLTYFSSDKVHLLLASVISVMFYQFYFTYMEGKFGQTIGKTLVSIELKKPNFNKSFMRNIPKSLFTLFPILLVLDSFPLFFNQKRFFDKISDSEVVLE